MLLIIEIALGIVLGVFLLWLIFYVIANYEPPRTAPKLEPTVWLVSIGSSTECMFDKDKGKGYCCRDMIYDPAFANTVRQFPTYDEAKAWSKEMVNVNLGDYSWEAIEKTHWHGNLKISEVTPDVAARYFEYRTPDGKIDPVFSAESAARQKVAEEKRAAEAAAHMARMQERRDRGQK